MLLLMLLLLRYRVFPAYQHSHQQSCTLVVSYLFHTCTLILVFAHSGTTKKSALVNAEHVALELQDAAAIPPNAGRGNKPAVSFPGIASDAQ